ncbi:hypothetical protein PSTT_05133 [Puccinia striiformis]|uniref:Tc1-like transposase DDE domain-containing protein n=1 Tax=Puccinia striiformis TaxID=27350 RepID=A0A2S4VPV4_9BASI|nr:hypothetical protein PSTT_05133 [Puccinia striiformis]
MVFVKYSAEIKTIVITLLLQGKSRDFINALLNPDISDQSLQRWFTLFNETQSAVEDATLYLDKIQCALVETVGEFYPISTIHDDLRKRLGLTRKVARAVHPAQLSAKRAQWLIDVSLMPAEFLVFVDESAICIATQCRQYGQAPKGMPTEQVVREFAGPWFSLLPGVSTEGVVGVMVQQGSILRPDFEFFLKNLLSWTTVVFHHRGRIEELCEAHNVVYMYLPPYSPDFNPIEKSFLVIKNHLKRAQVLTGTTDDVDIITDFVSKLVTPELMQALFRDCGYM